LAGNDTIFGDAGDDIIRGGAGADVLNGGAGTDLVTYFDSAVGISVNLATGVGTGGDAQGDTLIGFENLSGSQGNDTLVGTAGVNNLQGNNGNDVLRGGAGADALGGGAGTDTASYFDSAVGVSINLTAGTTAGGDAAGDILVSIENLTGSNLGNDTLVGNAGANTLQGWGGNDVLRGGAGADVLDGGTGTDTASYFDSAVGISINLTAGTAAGGDATGDTLTAIENISGSQGNDTLVGSTGANTLQGWNGNDVLVGAGGTDTLSGGAGADRFVYQAATESPVGVNSDLITDFSHAQLDLIDLSVIDANSGVVGNQAFTFIGAGLFTGVAGQLRYSIGGGVTTVAGDVNGDSASDFHIRLTGAIALVAGDFVL